MTTIADYLTIKEAAKRTNKAEITIRRFVHQVLEKKAASAQRKQIHPLPEEAVKLKKQGKPFVYTISQTLLHEKFPLVEALEKSAEDTNNIPPTEYVNLLERTNAGLLDQLKVKDAQIGALNTSLEQLSERQRETNVLMKLLQDKFILPAPAEEAPKKGWWKWRKKV